MYKLLMLNGIVSTHNGAFPFLLTLAKSVHFDKISLLAIMLQAGSGWIPRTYFIKCNEMDRRWKIIILTTHLFNAR
jgi:hypothetical protein